MTRRPWTLLALALFACGGGDKPPGTNTTAGTPSGGTTTDAEPPQAENDLATVDEGGSTVINMAVNDLVTTHPLALGSITVVSPPSAGELTVNVDGTADYVHDGSEGDADSYTYTIADATGVDSNIATVLITVDPVNDLPVANDDAAAVDQDATIELDLAGNDVDVDDGLDLASITITAAPANGTVTLNGDGTVDYAHDGSAFPTDSFTYTIDDDSGATSNEATVDLTVNTVNLPPLAVDDSDFVTEGAAITLDLVANDSDPDDGIDVTSVTLTSLPAYGSATLNGDGSIDYDHDGSEVVADSFTYTVADASGQPSNEASVQIIVLPSNDAPVAVDDAFGATEGSLTNLAVLANDSDAEGALAVATVTVVSPPSYGTAVPRPNGTVDYTHDGSAAPVDSFTYTVQDASGLVSNAATVSLTIGFTNDPPVAVNDAGIVAEGGTLPLDLAANDSDPDNALDLGSIAIVAGPTSGSVVVNGDGTVDYTHDGSEGATDAFTYTIDDVAGSTSNVASVQLTITGVNDPPVAVNDAVAVAEGVVNASLVVLANDSDPDDGLNAASVTIVTAPARGTATAQPDGTVRYTHNGSENPSDSFTYTVRDNSGVVSNTATVSITVNPVNDPPVAVDDGPALLPYLGGWVNVNVASNDSDPDGSLDLNSIQIVSYPSFGWATPGVPGTIDYYNYGYGAGYDGFAYTINDTQGGTSNVAFVDVLLPVVVSPPDAIDDHARVPTETWSTINAFGNDVDTGGGVNPGSLAIVSGPLNGVAIVNGDGTVDYFHDWTSGSTTDSFTYRISDYGGNASNVATVMIDVNAPSGCVLGFEDVWDAYGQMADPTLIYGAYGVRFDGGAAFHGVLGGMMNGDPGNWDVEGTNGTASWGMWNGNYTISWDEHVVDVSMDFIRAIQDQNFTVYAYRDGSLVDTASVVTSGAWDFQTVSFAGPLDEIQFSWASSFQGLDDLRYRAPALPCAGRVTDPTFQGGSYVNDLDAPFWGNKGYEFVANETFTITGGAWWLNLPVGGYVRLNIYTPTGTLLASGTTMDGLGIERWYHSELNFTFQAGQQYVASFYTNRAASAVMDRIDGYPWGYADAGLITVVGNRASEIGGDNEPEGFPTYGTNSWNPIQRLIRAPEVVQNLGYKSGSGDFSCPPWWRLPNLGEEALAMSWLNAGDTIDYYQNIAVDDPSGCNCKWNGFWCGQPSIETYDGRMCGDYAQLHQCVEDR